jgi:hypothetical protein
LSLAPAPRGIGPGGEAARLGVPRGEEISPPRLPNRQPAGGSRAPTHGAQTTVAASAKWPPRAPSQIPSDLEENRLLRRTKSLTFAPQKCLKSPRKKFNSYKSLILRFSNNFGPNPATSGSIKSEKIACPATTSCAILPSAHQDMVFRWADLESASRFRREGTFRRKSGFSGASYSGNCEKDNY